MNKVDNKGWLETQFERIKRHPVSMAIGSIVTLILTIGAIFTSIDSIRAHLWPLSGFVAPAKLVSHPPATNKVKSLPSAQSKSHAQTKLTYGSSPIDLTAKEVFSTLNDESLTQLQLEEFMHRTKGIVVQWEGTVQSVIPESREEARGAIDVFFVPDFIAKKETSLLDVMATCSNSEKADLSALSPGEEVKIQGRLDYLDVEPLLVMPILRNCELITFTKNEN